MTRLAWGTVGERFYEVGVDRGVLYVGAAPGVPWNGLISVTEESTGGEARGYYLDGIKYLNRAGREEFQATIEAYTYPDVFSQCDGSEEIKNGLYVTQQTRKPFGLAYRSGIGNDVQGVDHAYKLHLIYDATAAPGSKTSSTLSDSIDPFNFSWALTTRPPYVVGRKLSSHFVIDSRKVPKDLLLEIENILYGTVDTTPRIPPVDELVYLFEFFANGIFDARVVGMPYYNTFDGGQPPTAVQTSTINGGVP